jgi:hypothetical protein
VACLRQWARRRVHERYKVGEGWEYPFRLSESGTESGVKHPKSYFCRLGTTDYSF